MSQSFTSAELIAFLDEALPPADMARIEQALRSDTALAGELIALSTDRDGGAHTLGEIWRRGRLTCPSREQLAH
jgi:anti-sigma factor RsiW